MKMLAIETATPASSVAIGEDGLLQAMSVRTDPRGHVGFLVPAIDFCFAQAGWEPRDLDLIAVDAGSSDPGPYYLGSGQPFVGDAMTRRDLKLLVKAGHDAGVPVVIGSAGGAGGDVHVDRLLGLLREVSDELGLSPRVLAVRSELDKAQVKDAVLDQRVLSSQAPQPP